MIRHTSLGKGQNYPKVENCEECGRPLDIINWNKSGYMHMCKNWECRLCRNPQVWTPKLGHERKARAVAMTAMETAARPSRPQRASSNHHGYMRTITWA